MNKLIELIEKGKPFFEKISRNKYLRAIRDGFIAGMPVILFSSIFILIAYVPNAWGFHWSKDIETFLMTPYSYSMGDRKSTRLNSSHSRASRMPSSA